MPGLELGLVARIRKGAVKAKAKIRNKARAEDGLEDFIPVNFLLSFILFFL